MKLEDLIGKTIVSAEQNTIENHDFIGGVHTIITLRYSDGTSTRISFGHCHYEYHPTGVSISTR